MLLILSFSSFVIKSQSMDKNYVEINRDSLISKHVFYLTKGEDNKLMTFKLAAWSPNGLLVEIISPAGELSDGQIELIRQAAVGDKLYFTDIKFENKEGVRDIIEALTYRIKE